jgi:hypothetical protein
MKYMTAVRVKVHVTSDTIRAPEFRQFSGKDVEVIVLDENGSDRIARLAAEQGVKPFDFDSVAGLGRDFDPPEVDMAATIRQWRREDKPRKVPE